MLGITKLKFQIFLGGEPCPRATLEGHAPKQHTLLAQIIYL